MWLNTAPSEADVGNNHFELGKQMCSNVKIAWDDLWYIFHEAQSLVLWKDRRKKTCLHG